MTTPLPSQFDQIGFGLSALFELLKNIFEIAAIITGGVWTYFNFFKGRTYKPRLECEVEGSIETHSGQSFLKAIVKVKNVGLSKVSIDQTATILQLQWAVRHARQPSWPCHTTWSTDTAVFDVLADHHWIEPSETVKNRVLIELPCEKAPAYRLTLKLKGGNTSWTARNIIQLPKMRLAAEGACDDRTKQHGS